MTLSVILIWRPSCRHVSAAFGVLHVSSCRRVAGGSKNAHREKRSSIIVGQSLSAGTHLTKCFLGPADAQPFRRREVSPLKRHNSPWQRRHRFAARPAKLCLQACNGVLIDRSNMLQGGLETAANGLTGPIFASVHPLFRRRSRILGYGE
jgi:hypothetical protein